MAGSGKRMRPHTLTSPKPLIPIAGKSIVRRLVEDIGNMTDNKIDEIAFVTGDFGKETEKQLLDLARETGAEGKIYYQEKPLGTAHAIQCAKPSLEGPVVIAFADTLFDTDFRLDPNEDGIIWVKKIDDPTQFGVVEVNQEGVITRFVEKPEDFVSDLAIIGIYYFRDGKFLSDEIQYLLDKGIKEKGEFQLTNAMENMKNKNARFKVGEVKQWMDCGNKDATVDTNRRILDLSPESDLRKDNIKIKDSVVVEPCYIGENVEIKNSIIGPYVSISEGSKVESSVISGSIVLVSSHIQNANFKNSMIGNHVIYKKKSEDLNVGDYTKIYR